MKPRPFQFVRHVLRQQPETGESFLCAVEAYGLLDWDVVEHVKRLAREEDPLLAPRYVGYVKENGRLRSVKPLRSPKRLP